MAVPQQVQAWFQSIGGSIAQSLSIFFCRVHQITVSAIKGLQIFIQLQHDFDAQVFHLTTCVAKEQYGPLVFVPWDILTPRVC